MGYTYNFPPNRRAGSIVEQLKHAAGELIEAACEPNLLDMAIEMLDVQECVEGALRRLEGTRPGIVDLAHRRHYAKNSERGDYDVQDEA